MTQDDSHISFAKRLAHNNAKVRDDTLKKLRRWLATKSRSDKLEYTEMLKIWKGLHFSMWFSDKPLLQEALASDIAQIISVFATLEHSVQFFRGFCETISREWVTIDRLRLDKYYMFIRTTFRTVLEYCHGRQWDSQTVEVMCTAITDTIVSVSTNCPDSVLTYLSEQLYGVFRELDIPDIPSSVLTSFLLPYVSVIARTPKKDLCRVVLRNLFEPLTQDEFDLHVDKDALACRMFEEAKQKDILTRNRKMLYNMKRKLLSQQPGGGDTTATPLCPQVDVPQTQVENPSDCQPKPKKRKKMKASKTKGCEAESLLNGNTKCLSQNVAPDEANDKDQDVVGVDVHFNNQVPSPLHYNSNDRSQLKPSSNIKTSPIDEADRAEHIPTANDIDVELPVLEDGDEKIPEHNQVDNETSDLHQDTADIPETAINQETKENTDTNTEVSKSPVPEKYRRSKRAKLIKIESVIPTSEPTILTKARTPKSVRRKKSLVTSTPIPPSTTSTTTSPPSTPASNKKKVRYSLENNTVKFFRKNSSVESPTPYDGEKTPVRGVLKLSPAVTRSQSRRKTKSKVKL